MPILDLFINHTNATTSPPARAASITPDDDNDLEYATRAINVAAAGNVALVTAGGDSATVYVAAGIAFPVRAYRVLETGTTATGIVGLF